MTLSKTELRAAGMHDVGARLDDELEKAQALASAGAGAVSALEAATRDISGFVNLIQSRVDEGTLTMDEGKQQIAGIEMATNGLKNLAAQARKNQEKLDGAVHGLRKAVEVTSNLHTIELKKAGMQEDELIPAADPMRQANGPKKTIKQQRLEEEAKKPTAKKKTAKKKRVTKKKAAKKKVG
jgi:hypothetical protein